MLVGVATGPALVGASMALYLAWAVLGLPVLAPDADGSHRVGVDVLLLASATGGYLWGFVVAAAVTGWLARRGWDRSLRSSISVMLLGSIVIYLFGVPWLIAALDLTVHQDLEFGLYPFVVGDVLKLLAAAALLPARGRYFTAAVTRPTGPTDRRPRLSERPGCNAPPRVAARSGVDCRQLGIHAR